MSRKQHMLQRLLDQEDHAAGTPMPACAQFAAALQANELVSACTKGNGKMSKQAPCLPGLAW